VGICLLFALVASCAPPPETTTQSPKSEFRTRLDAEIANAKLPYEGLSPDFRAWYEAELNAADYSPEEREFMLQAAGNFIRRLLEANAVN
jgi:hypothetical protein